jgi:hypothetical protein
LCLSISLKISVSVGGREEAIHPACQQVANLLLLDLWIFFRIRNEGRVAAGPNLVGNPLGELTEKGVCQVRNYHPDSVSTPRSQTPGNQVGLIVQFPDALQDPPPGGGTDVTVAAKDFGYRNKR